MRAAKPVQDSCSCQPEVEEEEELGAAGSTGDDGSDPMKEIPSPDNRGCLWDRLAAMKVGKEGENHPRPPLSLSLKPSGSCRSSPADYLVMLAKVKAGRL